MHRHIYHAAIGAGLLFLFVGGCKQAAPPMTDTPASQAIPSDLITDFHAGESIPAIFELTVDPDALTATAQPLATRTAAGFQASQFDLDITKFQTAAQFEPRSVQFTNLGDVEVTFRHAHPWAAPDITKPPSAINRADLSYTGRLLILADLDPADIASHTFFTDVKANTELIRGADGYVQPGDLLAKTGFNANCFPYMLLADEAKDNRIGVSNNNAVTGNWDPAVGGWQRANLGPNGDGWTGFDFVHAGQTIENAFVLNADALTGGPITLKVALLIKYTEPKGIGGEAGRTLRLPPATVNVLDFAYRAPHAALDGSALIQEIGLQEGTINYFPIWPMDVVQLESTPGATAGFGNLGRDWDVNSLEATTPDLATESDIATVRPGANGAGQVHIDCPPISATGWDLAAAGYHLTGPIEGHPEKEIWWNGQLSNDLGLDTGGALFREVPALLRWTDPEAALAPDATPHVGVDPQSLASDPDRAIAPITFQALTIRIVDPAPTWTVYNIDPNSVNGSGLSLAIIPDAEGPGEDRLGISYFDESARLLKYARATTKTPTQPSDWLITIVDPVANQCVEQSKLIAYQGKPVLIYWDMTGTGSNRMWRIRCAQATTATPSSPSDWNLSVVKGDFPPFNYPPGNPDRPKSHIDLAIDSADNLILAAGNYTTQDVWFFRALTPTPTGIADWWAYQIFNISDGTPPGEMSEPDTWLEVDGGTIWCLAPSAKDAALQIGDRNFWLWRSRTPAPLQPSDWEDWSRIFDRDPYGDASSVSLGATTDPFAVDGGMPLLASSFGGWMYLTKPASSLSWSWTVSFWESRSTATYRAFLTYQAARPQVAYFRSVAGTFGDQEIRIARGLVSRPEHVADWQRSAAPPPFGAYSANLGYVPYQNREVVAFKGASANPQLHLAFTNSAWK